MTQLPLLVDVARQYRPRRHVERTSVRAAQEIKPLLDVRQALAIDAVRRWPGRTSGELAGLASQDVLAMRIGLSMLKQRGFVEHVPHGARACARSGKTCVTWRVRQR